MEFNLVQETNRAPFNKCYLCGDFSGPFIDTFYDQYGHGAVFICAPAYDPITGEMAKGGCLGQMAAKAGMVSGKEVEDLRLYITELEIRIEELEAQESQIVMSEKDFRSFFQKQTANPYEASAQTTPKETVK